MKSPLVSIILPVKNGEDSIALTIESLLSQTFNDFELIIINDGSIDKTQSIIEGYQANDCRILLINQNLGLTKALNKGVEISRGIYIARQDCGDISYPNRLSLQVEYLNKHEEISACFTWVNIISKDRRILGPIIYSTSPEKIRRNLIRGNNRYTHGSIMLKRSSLLAVGGYDEQVELAQDFDLYLKMIKYGFKIGAVNKILYEWLLDSRSLTISKCYKQREYQYKALLKFYGKPTLYHFAVNKYDCDSALYRFLLNIYFRAGNRKLFWYYFKKLLKNRQLKCRDFMKLLLVVSSINYKIIFRYL